MPQMHCPPRPMHPTHQGYVPASLTAITTRCDSHFVGNELNETYERDRIMDVDVRNIVIAGQDMPTNEDVGGSGGECSQPTTRNVRLLAR